MYYTASASIRRFAFARPAFRVNKIYSQVRRYANVNNDDGNIEKENVVKDTATKDNSLEHKLTINQGEGFQVDKVQETVNVTRNEIIEKIPLIHANMNVEDITKNDNNVVMPLKTKDEIEYITKCKEKLFEWVNNQKEFPDKAEAESTKYKIFDIYPTIPVRSKIPEIPSKYLKKNNEEIEDPNKLLNFYKQLTRYSYPRQERDLYVKIKTFYNIHKDDDNIKLEFLKYHLRRNFTIVPKQILKMNQDLFKNEKLYLTLIEENSNIFKECKLGKSSLEKLIRRLNHNKIKISGNLIYKLSFILPNQLRHYFIELLKNKMNEDDLNLIIQDNLNMNNFNDYPTFDKLKNAIYNNEIKLTYGYYILLNKLMIKDFKIDEGLKLINYLIIIKKYEIPTFLCKYTLDLILSKNMQLLLPSSVLLQKITNNELKNYSSKRLISLILASKIINKNTITLMLFFNKSKLLDIKREQNKFFKKIEETNDEELINFYKEFEESTEFKELNKFFHKIYFSNDTYFKAGNLKFNEYNKINKLLPPFRKISNLYKEIDELFQKNNFNLTSIWLDYLTTIFNGNEKNLEISSQIALYYCNSLILNNKFPKFGRLVYGTIITTVCHLKNVYNIDIRFKMLSILSLHIVKNSNTVKDDIDYKTAASIMQEFKLVKNDFFKEDLLNYPLLEIILEDIESGKNFAEYNHLYNLMQELEWSTADLDILNEVPASNE